MSTVTLVELLNPAATTTRTHVDTAKVAELARRAIPGLPDYDPAAPVCPNPEDEGAAARVADIVEAAIAHGALTLPTGVAVQVNADVDDDGEGVYVLVELAAAAPVKITFGWQDVGSFTPSADQYETIRAEQELSNPTGCAPLAVEEAATRAAYYDTITAAAATIDALLGQPVACSPPAEAEQTATLTASVKAAYAKATADDRPLLMLALDDLVHDAAAGAAAAVNNSGIAAQVAYLIEHEGAAAAAELITEACDGVDGGAD